MQMDIWFLFSANCLIVLEICTKFCENILDGFRCMDRTRSVTDRQSNRETTMEKTICLPLTIGWHTFCVESTFTLFVALLIFKSLSKTMKLILHYKISFIVLESVVTLLN